MSIEGVVISGLVTLAVAWLGYLGLRDQNRTAKLGSDSNTLTAERAQVLAAWKEFIGPLQDELDRSNGKIAKLEEAHSIHEKKLAALTSEVHRWQSVAKTLARWGITMRDQLRGLGHEVPAEPDELVALRIVSDVNDNQRLP